jgi:hemolysin activation/secretion protein
VQGEFSDFVYTGNSDNLDLGIQYLVYRNETSKTTMDVHLQKAVSQNFLDDVEVEVQHRNVTTAELGLGHHHFFKKAQVDLSLTYKQGVPILGAQRDPAKQNPDGPTTLFKIFNADIDVLVPLSTSWRYRNHLRGQYTGDRLSGQDQFAIGGRYTIRGFDGDNILSGDNGWYTRNEVGVTLPYVSQELFFGIDYGQVSGPSTTTLPGKSLTGGFIGMRGSYKSFSYEVFTGWAISKPSDFDSAQPATGFRLTAQY